MSTEIVGASVWEQAVYDHLVAHGRGEGAILAGYQELAESTSVPAFAYLARLILEDERRHHQLLSDLAESIRATAEGSLGPTPIPGLGDFQPDAERIIAQTERFIEMEEHDSRELEHLARDLRGVRETTAWELVVRLMQDDNNKHRRILAFIRDVARRQKR